MRSFLLAASLLPMAGAFMCPAAGDPPAGHPVLRARPVASAGYREAVEALDWEAVKEDIKLTLQDS